MSLSGKEWIQVANAISGAAIGRTDSGPIVMLEDVFRTLILYAEAGAAYNITGPRIEASFTPLATRSTKEPGE